MLILKANIRKSIVNYLKNVFIRKFFNMNVDVAVMPLCAFSVIKLPKMIKVMI